MSLKFDDFWLEWQQPFDRYNDRLAGITGVGELMAELSALMKIDVLNET